MPAFPSPALGLACVLSLVLAPAVLRAADAAHPVLPLGAPVPDFDLPGVDGRRWTLHDFREAKVLCLVFTCNHCPTAQAYEERLKALARDYQPRGVALVAINPNHPDAVRLDELGYTDLDDTLESMKLRAAQRSFNFPYLDDGPNQELSRRVGPAATPHVFVFDAQRKLRYQGRIDDSERESLVRSRDTREALDALLAGREPAVGQTRVFGCSTKWADKAAASKAWRDKVRQEPVSLENADAEALRSLRTHPANKVRLINVWATWCGPCITEFPELIDTNLQFRHRDFELVTVAAQFPDERPKVLEFLKKQGASSRNLLFGDTDKHRLLEALDPEWNGALPHTLLVGPKGQVLFRHTGPLDFLELRRKIVPALDAIAPWGG